MKRTRRGQLEREGVIVMLGGDAAVTTEVDALACEPTLNKLSGPVCVGPWVEMIFSV